MASATGNRRRWKEVRPAGLVASPHLLLLSLLLASAPDSGGSFLFPTGKSGGCDGDGGSGATLTASCEGRRGGGGYNFSRGRAGRVLAIVVGGTAKKTGGGGGGGGGLTGAKRGRGSSPTGMPSDERRGVLGAKKVSEGRAWVFRRRRGGVHMTSIRTASAVLPEVHPLFSRLTSNSLHHNLRIGFVDPNIMFVLLCPALLVACHERVFGFHWRRLCFCRGGVMVARPTTGCARTDHTAPRDSARNANPLDTLV